MIQLKDLRWENLNESEGTLIAVDSASCLKFMKRGEVHLLLSLGDLSILRDSLKKGTPMVYFNVNPTSLYLSILVGLSRVNKSVLTIFSSNKLYLERSYIE